MRLTVAFALALVLVLAGAAAFVYVRLRADLDDGVDATLQARAHAGAVLQSGPRAAGARDAVLDDPEESFVQILTPHGRLVAQAGRARIVALAPTEIRRATRDEVMLERSVPGVEGRARVLGRAAVVRRRTVVVAAGQSLGDRDETLSGVVTSFAVGGAAAVVVASVIGYLLAGAGLAPVEAMRRRARDVSLTRSGEQLPLPVAHDEIRRLGETLNQMLVRLHRSFERERHFVADASHELRTPIAVIKTELEGALATADYGPEVRAALVAAVEECDHLIQLAEDLLVIAGAGEGELPVRREAIPADELLDGVRARFVDRAARQGRAIRLDVDGVDRVSADPLRLRQALGNLVDNALRHGDGEIVLRAHGSPDGVELVVSDAGPGFASDIAPRAFQRFARGDQDRMGGGTGLGLAIVRAVAEAHGGTATIVLGTGAGVRLWLPH
ncbi:MAG: sensor histidine kinase [Solirubrobacteraceae bacterium]